MKRLIIIAATAYAIGALITFGHCAANGYVPCSQRNDKYCAPSDPTIGAAGAGLMAAIFWPFYWSWELQS